MRTRLLCAAAAVSVTAALAACAPSQSNEGEPAETSDEIVLGLTVSRTGKLTAESKEQLNGLELWASQVNAAGGIDAGEKKLKVTLKTYDDESEKTRVQQLYTRLVQEDHADFLVSPYSSGLAAASAVVAEQYGTLMLATGAASDSIFTHGYQHVFQVYTPASRYLTGSVDLLRAASPNVTKIAIVHEEEAFSTDVATATREYAKQQGLDVVLFEGYPTGTTDFGPFINRIEAASPQALLGGGHFADGSTLARQLRAKAIPLEMVSLLVAPSVPEFVELGDAGLGVVGPSQWEPDAAYSEELAAKEGLTWFGPSAKDVVSDYTDKYGHAPGYHAAGGYASGLLLQYAIEKAGSVETDAVRKVLEGMHALTFYGELQFEAGQSYGKQVGHEMVQIQWQKGSDGKLERRIVWPEAGKTADYVSGVK